MRPSLRCWILLVLPFSALLDTVIAEQASPDKLRAVAISAYQANNALIQTLSATISETTEDASVDATAIIKHSLSEGRELSVIRQPRQAVKTTVTLSGNRQKLVRLFEALPTNGSGREEFTATDGRWIQYLPEIKAAWVNHMCNSPKMLPISPLQVGSTELHLTLTDCLRQEKLVSGGFVTQADDVDAIRLVTQDLHGETITRHFGANVRFMPTRWESHWPDGSLLQTIEYQYGDVLDGRAKVLKSLVRRFYHQGVAHDMGNPGWHQQISRQVDVTNINTPVPPAVFDVTFPAGTRITDNTKGTVYQVASSSPSPARRHASTWGIVATLSVMVSLAYMLVTRR